MDRLIAFGLFAVTAMLVTYALEARSRWFILAFAGACRNEMAAGRARPRISAGAATSSYGGPRCFPSEKTERVRRPGMAFAPVSTHLLDYSNRSKQPFPSTEVDT